MTERVLHHSEPQRFEFGENWSRFLEVLNDTRIQNAEQSLKQMLKVSTLRGLTFLDIGSGSGLFSLAAWRLGARVHSFDYDVRSVACTSELKRQFCSNGGAWTIEQGDVLNEAYVCSLGQFDIVYSWGVLHHTGAMWQALANAQLPVGPNGQLHIAIYNDQGRPTRYWKVVKRLYNRLPKRLKFIILWPGFLRMWAPTILRDCFSGRPLQTWRTYFLKRGMSPWRDAVDWIGGYPFEAAKLEEVSDFYRERKLTLRNFKAAGGRGCNEFVFQRQEQGKRP